MVTPSTAFIPSTHHLLPHLCVIPYGYISRFQLTLSYTGAPRKKTPRGPDVFCLFSSLLYPQSLKQCLARTKDSINNYWVNEQMNVFPVGLGTLVTLELTAHYPGASAFVSVFLTCLWFLAKEFFVSGLPLKCFLTTYSVYSFPFTLQNRLHEVLWSGPSWWRQPTHKKEVS